VSNEVSHEFRIIQRSCDEFGLSLKGLHEVTERLNLNEAGCFWIVALPGLLEVGQVCLEDLETFLLVGISEAVQDNCDEKVQKDDAHDELEQHKEHVREGCATAVRLSIVGHDT